MLNPAYPLKIFGKKNKQAGFTMIEVLISLAILTFGILAVAAMQASAIKGNNTGRSLSEATTLAQNWIETIILLPFDPTEGGTVIPPSGTPDLQDALGANGGTAGLNDGLLYGNTADYTLANIGPGGQANGRYNIDFNYADSDLNGMLSGNDVKTIRLIVTWQDEGGTQFSDGIRRRKVIFNFVKSKNLEPIS